MNKQHAKALRIKAAYLVNHLSRLEDVLDIMLSDHIISMDHRERIMSHTIQKDCVRHFLDTLLRSGPCAFDSFLHALEETEQKDIVEALESELMHTGKARNTPISAVPERYTPILAPSTIVTNESSQRSQPFQPYTVKSTPRGYILIVNVEHYVTATNVPSRLGSNKDVENIRSLFQDFGYSVCVLQDPTGSELEESVKVFTKKTEHSTVDACGLFILSHGVEHHIIASDGTYVSIDQLLSCFTNPQCPYLAGKPKLLVIQACRGEIHDHIFPPNSALNVSVVDHSLDPASWLSLPYMTDSVIVYSTLPGFVSWRSETSGSLYVTHFVDVFRTHGHHSHVMDMLAEVNNRLVEECSSANIRQISQPVNTLRRPFYLYTKD